MIYLVLTVLLILSAFFSSLETGLLSLGEVNIRQWSKQRIRSLDIWLKEPASIITGILFGNNLVNIVFSALFTVMVVHLVTVRNIPGNWAEIISILFSSVMILIMGEIIPKTFANTHPDRVVSTLYVPFMKFYTVSKSVINLLNRVSFSMVGVMKLKREKLISRKELHLAIRDIESSGVLKGDFSNMLGKVLFLTQRMVSEVMVPRRMIYAVDLNWEYEHIMETLLNSRYSRIPAYYGKFDDFRGFIYIKDIIKRLHDYPHVDFEKILRKPYVTYPGRSCHHLFHEMRNKRVHCAVVKSNRRIVGLVTIEDLIEEIVGEIYDEYDYAGGSG